MHKLKDINTCNLKSCQISINMVFKNYIHISNNEIMQENSELFPSHFPVLFDLNKATVKRIP